MDISITGEDFTVSQPENYLVNVSSLMSDGREMLIHSRTYGCPDGI